VGVGQNSSRSDAEICLGRFQPTLEVHPYTGYPVVQGHEVSGVISEVGDQVEDLVVGDKVTFTPQVTCGQCYPCTHSMCHIPFCVISGRTGPNLILECVGVQETIAQAVENARKGTTIVIVGVFGEKPVVDIGLVQDRELSLVGTLMYQKPDYERAIELVAGGKLCLDKMITHHFPFREYMNAYKMISEARGNVMKVMITLD